MLRPSNQVLVAVLFVFLLTCVPLVAQTTHTVTSNADSGAGSLRAILEGTLNDGDTILFNILGGNTITLSSPLPQINVNDLTFGGTTPVIIDGDGNRIFDFGNSVSRLSLTNIVVDGSAGTGAFGGAIHCAPARNITLLLDGVRFQNNTATSRSAAIEIFGGGGTRILTNTGITVFDGNATNGSGGAINTNLNLTLENIDGGTILFVNNAATGAIDYYSSGGAISTVDLFVGSGVTFDANTAHVGGAAYLLGDLSLDSILFQNNTAANMGGAVFFVDMGSNRIFPNPSFSTLTNTGNTNFIGNTATNQGGAIATYALAGHGGTTGALVITNTDGGTITFTGNRTTAADGQGGAIDAEGDVTVGQGVTFDDNLAAYGGAIYSTGTDHLLDSTTFQNNTATDFGGAIFFNSEAVLTSTGNTTFTNNTAEHHGGAIIAMDALNITNVGSGTLKFTDNQAVSSVGGAIYAGGDVVLANTGGGTITFTDNTAGSTSGAIYSGGNVSIGSGVTFDGNSAEQAGAIQLHGSPGPSDRVLSLNSTTFQNNVATGTREGYGGGAVYFSGRDDTLSNAGNTVFH